MSVPRQDRFKPLFPDAAFVVQLREADPDKPDQVCGRVEHIASGCAAGFCSLAELRDFMAEALQTPRGYPSWAPPKLL